MASTNPDPPKPKTQKGFPKQRTVVLPCQNLKGHRPIQQKTTKASPKRHVSTERLTLTKPTNKPRGTPPTHTAKKGKKPSQAQGENRQLPKTHVLPRASIIFSKAVPLAGASKASKSRSSQPETFLWRSILRPPQTKKDACRFLENTHAFQCVYL